MDLQLGLASVIVGIGLHVVLFRHGEWHLFVYKFKFIHILAVLLLIVVGVHLTIPGKGWAQDASAASCLVAGLVSGVWSSMLVYRAFFHRLTRQGFSGPFVARLSQFYQTSLAAKNLRISDEIEVLHKKYGDIVRIGPQELSVADPRAMVAIHGTNTKRTACTKSVWYDMLYPGVSLQTERDRQVYSLRRKPWDQAFSSKALSRYEDRVNRLVAQLMGGIKNNQDRPFNVSQWFGFWGFDLMGELAFGEGFKLMDRNEEDYYYKTTARFLPMISIFGPIPWLFPIIKRIPILNRESNEFDEFQAGMFWKRFRSEPKEPDIFEWIVQDYRKITNPTEQETTNAKSDVGLIVVAGSETTRLSLTILFYNFACHPPTYRKLQEEVDTFMRQQGAPSPDAVENSALSKLEYLQACIDESLRYINPNPSGLPRQTPPEGLWVGGRWIPGDVNVRTANNLIMRDPRAFVRPDEFIPERWTTRRGELVVDASAHMPFSAGRFSCPGKQLALMNLRRVAALIAHGYDVAFAPGQKPEDFTGGMLDHFTRGVPKLDLVFTRRKA
ncbi:hypothetical protein KVR01_010369 [Diaporthe batatas]|uniref:uncharacterized protein n=1 Tax=Diaporthe batatas TaxID=748121 RepID=UPI001D0530DC|nr:uncharacterized protein KVR01_010369 [Diaporthe batatas]KAG8159732.1 hypothetical protein KVR01_010369 [Diaporthe batatas]